RSTPRPQPLAPRTLCEHQLKLHYTHTAPRGRASTAPILLQGHFRPIVGFESSCALVIHCCYCHIRRHAAVPCRNISLSAICYICCLLFTILFAVLLSQNALICCMKAWY